jgi:2-polyprenyl-6-methoxyphenol hydroxylase-like FAD-dependent oxidoreductase
MTHALERKHMTTETSVLIVGGSLNGLTAALLLSHRHVPCVLVERHPRTSIQYKFRGISPRSMEIYRSLGIEGEIRRFDDVDDREAQVARKTNLAAPDTAWQGVPWSDTRDLSPTTAAVCDQDQLEPILRAHAERLGADVRFNTELVEFEQDEDGVVGLVRDRSTGHDDTVRAAYLIAADGTAGGARKAMGIERRGPGVLQHWMNVIFETDLPTTIDGRAIRSVFLTDINGAFVPRAGGRWLMAVQYVPEQGQSPEDFTQEYCRRLIRRGAGRDVKADIVDVRPWDAAALVADRFSDRRAFLVGDTAHVMPPTGGFGGNTGIHDVHNLAWKLDAVLRGAAGPQLLATYDQERRPVAERTLAQALARLQAWFKDPRRKLPPPEPIVADEAVIFGYCYPSGAFIDDGTDTHAAHDVFEDPRTSSARPGSRAPHVMVEHRGEPVSTIDLFAGQWALVTGSKGTAWVNAVRRRDDGRVGLRCYQFGAGDLRDADHRWSTASHLGDEDAMLIRPDGFIAWRGSGRVADPDASLDDAIDQLTGRRSREAAATRGS